MVLEILSKLSLDKYELIVRILDGGILFLFATIFLTSAIINIKNKNLKSIIISTIFILIYMIASLATFFGLFFMKKFNIPLSNNNYFTFCGVLAFIQIVMIVLLYFFADPYAEEKRIKHMKQTGEYYRLLQEKRDKEQKKIDEKTEKKRIRREKREAKRIERQEKKKEKLAKKALNKKG